MIEQLLWKFLQIVTMLNPLQINSGPSGQMHETREGEKYVHYSFLSIVSIFCCLIASINLDLYLELRGLVLNLYPQQGQKNPSHFMNISHT
jgi:hypothetical protein